MKINHWKVIAIIYLFMILSWGMTMMYYIGLIPTIQYTWNQGMGLFWVLISLIHFKILWDKGDKLK